MQGKTRDDLDDLVGSRDDDDDDVMSDTIEETVTMTMIATLVRNGRWRRSTQWPGTIGDDIMTMTQTTVIVDHIGQ